MAICPYCEKEIKGENLQKETIKAGVLRKNKIMYSCPNCQKILSLVTDE